MQVDWRQIATHVLGFIIAVLILKRYAWGPILRLLEERREKIAGEFERIDLEKKAAAVLKSDYEAQLRNIEVQARARLQEAVHEGQKVAADIREQARRDAHAQLERAREEAERDRDKASVSLRNDMVEMVVGASERLIRERLDDEKHRQLIAEFITSLEALPAGGAQGTGAGRGA